MSINEEARELMAQERKHDEHIHESMLNRSVQDLETHPTDGTDEKARELLAQERHHQEHLQENMLSRATEEIN
jgi:hypothetical protein